MRRVMVETRDTAEYIHTVREDLKKGPGSNLKSVEL